MLSGDFARPARQKTPVPEEVAPIAAEHKPLPALPVPNIPLLKKVYFASGVFSTLAVIVGLLLLLRLFQ